MDKDELIGNITTIGKFILITFGTPSMVSFANSNEFVILISAIFGLIWAFLDSKYFNTFFDNNKEVTPIAKGYDESLNPEYESIGDDDE